MRIAWPFQHQHIPSEPWDTSHWILWTDVCSGISGGLEAELHLEWSELQSTVPALWFRELRDVGREIHIGSSGEKLLNSSAFSVSVFTSSHILFIKSRYVYFSFPFSSQCSWLCISFLHFRLIRRSLVSHVCLLLPLPVFLHMVIESSWAL